MGVRKLFGYVKRRHRHVLLRSRTRTMKVRAPPPRPSRPFAPPRQTEELKEVPESREVPLRFTGYGVDGNALLHEAAQWEYGYGKYEARQQGIPDTLSEGDSKDPKAKRVPNPAIEERHVPSAKTVAERFIFLVKEGRDLLDPEHRYLRRLYIAIDGPAPLAKAQQQRTRRYLAAARASSEGASEADADVDEGENGPSGRVGAFDSSVISPGTPFMDEIDDAIRKWLRASIATLPRDTVYWSHRTPGEGEHKIIDALGLAVAPRTGMQVKGGRKVVASKDEGYDVIYGNDNDLIILGLVRTRRTMILRDALDREGDLELIRNPPELGRFCLLDVDALRHDLEREYSLSMPDFSVLALLLGNDFVPTTPAAFDVYSTLETVMSLYAEIKAAKPKSKAGKENPRYVLYDDRGMHWDDLYVLVAALVRGDREEAMLVKRFDSEEYSNSERNRGYDGKPPQRIEKTAALWSNTYVSEGRTRVDVEAFRDAYWRHAFPGLQESPDEGDVVLDVVDAYIEAFVWSTTYYVRGVSAVNVEWFYRYHYAPMLLEVREVLRAFRGEALKRWELLPLDTSGRFLNPLELEIAILPLNVLNDVLYGEEGINDELASKVFAPLRDLFPVQVDVDAEGTDIQDKAIVRLPFVDADRVREVAKSLNRADVAAVERKPLVAPFAEQVSGRTKSGRVSRAKV